MRPVARKKLLLAAAASSGLLGLVGYPVLKSTYPVRKQPVVIDDYVDLPTATADLTKDITLPEGVGTSTDVPVNVSHWLLLSMLKSKSQARRDRALNELARQRTWNDAECMEIAQALERKDIIKLARTIDADLRLFMSPPSLEFIEKALTPIKIDKLVKTILKDISESSDFCSSCANFYTNLSIRIRPDANILAMNDLNQVDKTMRLESRKRKRSAYNGNVIRLKAILNNVLCGEQQALSMVQAGLLVALLYFHHKYPDDIQVNGLISQIIANITLFPSTRNYLHSEGWIHILTQYSRSHHLELSMPAFKALANLDEESRKDSGVYGNHVYLLGPLYRCDQEPKFDVIFVHGLVGSVFKSWRQGTVVLDEHGNRVSSAATPTTELLPNAPSEPFPDDNQKTGEINQFPSSDHNSLSRCWPKDWLYEDVPDLRILAVDYPSALSSWRTDCDSSKDTLRERAKHVMRQLEAAKLGDRPIIWVSHSMGGLLVKQILVLCHEKRQREQQDADQNGKPSEGSSDCPARNDLLSQTKGVVFYSVPHKGSNLGWIERKNLQKLLLLTTEVIELQKGSRVLKDLDEKFRDVIKSHNGDIKFLTFAENAISSFGVNKVVQWRGVLVHEDSLRFELGPIYKLDMDHANTCKPHSRNSITYIKTLDLIRELVPKPPNRDAERLIPFISFIF